MRYQMKQEIFALGDDFTIADEDNNFVASVDGKLLALGKKLAFLDATGREVALIKEKLISLKKSYEITRDGKHVATVSKDLLSLLRVSFTVDVPGPDDLEAQGSFTEHEYTFSRHGKKVATVSKAWLSLRDCYGVDVVAGEDPILILASTVVIDLCCHDGKPKT